MKVYISGPITGIDRFMDNFDKAEEWLVMRGYDTCNPARENSKYPAGTEWRVYMGESLKLLCGCQAIYMLEGWQRSEGAKLEYLVATHLGMKVMEEDKR